MISNIIKAIGVVAIFTAVQSMSFEDDLQSNDRYCNQVKLYESSGGRYGWPDFKGGELCD